MVLMFGYSYIFLYCIFTQIASSLIYKNNLEISKKIQKIYNVIICGLSLMLTINAYKIVKEYSFSDVACYNNFDININNQRYLFFILKFVEWFDTVMLLQKYNGDISKISNLHYYHHAIVPTMTHYGMFQPGEVFVYLTNSFAHFLMYGYYAFPEILFIIKPIITYYQYFQHVFMLFIMMYQCAYNCNVSYPIINIIGYVFFFYEYMKLIYPTFIKVHNNVSNINVYSSCLFILNSLYLCSKNDIVYRNSFILLTISSILYHQTGNKVIMVMDKMLVYNIIYQGGIRLAYLYHKSILHTVFVVLNFLSTIFLYYYETNIDNSNAHIYHAMLHACSSMGHLSIIYLLE